LVFGHFEGLGLIFIKVEAAERMLNMVSSQLEEITRLVKESKTGDVEVRGKGNRSQ
jgi:hypothetical protein